MYWHIPHQISHPCARIDCSSWECCCHDHCRSQIFAARRDTVHTHNSSTFLLRGESWCEVAGWHRIFFNIWRSKVRLKSSWATTTFHALLSTPFIYLYTDHLFHLHFSFYRLCGGMTIRMFSKGFHRRYYCPPKPRAISFNLRHQNIRHTSPQCTIHHPDIQSLLRQHGTTAADDQKERTEWCGSVYWHAWWDGYVWIFLFLRIVLIFVAISKMKMMNSL